MGVYHTNHYSLKHPHHLNRVSGLWKSTVLIIIHSSTLVISKGCESTILNLGQNNATYLVCRSLQLVGISKQLGPQPPSLVHLPKRVHLLQVLLVVAHLANGHLVTHHWKRERSERKGGEGRGGEKRGGLGG